MTYQVNMFAVDAAEQSGFKAKVIAVSGNSMAYGAATMLWSIQLRYPRFILPQLNTHTVLSKSSSSSRAIPVAKLIEEVMTDPVLPVMWGKNRKGMQATEFFEGNDVEDCIDDWLRLRDEAVKTAQSMAARGVHKQLVNRVLEPWVWQHTILTGTEWDNFLNLRRHDAAQPEIMLLANLINYCMTTTRTEDTRTNYKHVNEPSVMGRWHLPYITEEEIVANRLSDLGAIYVSVARCARVSYNNHEGTRDVFRDIELAKTLMISGHMSPWQHVARPMTPEELDACRIYKHESDGQILYRKELMGNAVLGWDAHPSHFIGNYEKWMPYRKLIAGENIYLASKEERTEMIPPQSAFFIDPLGDKT